MPSKYVIRNFAENSFYHVFNRGVEKRNIFLDNQDYNLFLYYTYIYLAPLEQVLVKYPNLPLRLHSKNLHDQLDLVAYCLMPNHFHFLFRQNTIDAISKFMKQLTNAHTLYFNQKYERVGGLVQGRFRAVLIETDELLLHVSRYIHLNPITSKIVTDPLSYKWSSYQQYFGKPSDLTCSKELILSHFPSQEAFRNFTEDQIAYAQELEQIKHLTLDD